MTAMLETFEAPSRPLVDKRQAAFARLVARVVDSLNEAVTHRVSNGATKSALAAKIGCDKSSLSRALRASDQNLTLKTISDIFWACDYEPEDFDASPIEEILSSKRSAVNTWYRPKVRQKTSVVPAFKEMEVRIVDNDLPEASHDVALERWTMAFSQ